MYSDFKKIKKQTNNNDKIMFFIPAYIALLSDRVGAEINFKKNPAGDLILQQSDKSDYVYLSRLHPRKTREDINGLYIYQYFRDWTNLEWVSYSKETEEPVSYFLKVK